jgi:adenosine deaminase
VFAVAALGWFAMDATREDTRDVMLQQIRELPKLELHLHLGGSWPLSFLEEIASPVEFEALRSKIRQLNTQMDYHEAFEIFTQIAKLVNTEQLVERGVVALCKELERDKVEYVEIRTGLKDLGNGFEGYLNAITRGLSQCNIDAVLLLSLRRDSNAKLAEETLRLAEKCNRVVGIDLSGDSCVGDATALANFFGECHKRKLPITLHLGESKDENEQRQLAELQLIVPQRIGHGVYLFPAAAEWIKQHHTPVEMCISSAFQASMVHHISAHPMLKWMQSGHPVVIATDDPLIFSTDLSSEIYSVAQLLRWSIADVSANQQIARSCAFRHK